VSDNLDPTLENHLESLVLSVPFDLIDFFLDITLPVPAISLHITASGCLVVEALLLPLRHDPKSTRSPCTLPGWADILRLWELLRAYVSLHPSYCARRPCVNLTLFSSHLCSLCPRLGHGRECGLGTTIGWLFYNEWMRITACITLGWRPVKYINEILSILFMQQEAYRDCDPN